MRLSLTGRRTLVAAAIFLCIALCAFVKAPYGTANVLTDPVDFNVFRCAATALVRGGDPYRVEPLRSCEHASLARVGLAMTPGVVIPAPLPPYAFAAYVPYVALPYERATIVFTLLCVAASTFAVARLRALTGLPLVVVAVAVLLCIWLPSVTQGQPVPIVAAALCGAAWEARRHAPRRATFSLAFATLEPHLIAATLLALLTRRAFRVPIVVLACALAVLSFVTLGTRGIVEYVRIALPEHAAAELGWLAGQQTFAAAYFAVGHSLAQTLALANVAWLCGVAISVAIARRLARATGDDAYLVLVPAMVALPWAPYLHATQYGLAVPGALLLAGRFAATRLSIGCALALLVVPWNDIGTTSAPIARGAYHAVPAANDFASAGLHAYIAALAANDGRSRETLLWLKVPIFFAFAAMTASALASAAISDSDDRFRRSRSRSRSCRGAA